MTQNNHLSALTREQSKSLRKTAGYSSELRKTSNYTEVIFHASVQESPLETNWFDLKSEIEICRTVCIIFVVRKIRFPFSEDSSSNDAFEHVEYKNLRFVRRFDCFGYNKFFIWKILLFLQFYQFKPDSSVSGKTFKTGQFFKVLAVFFKSNLCDFLQIWKQKFQTF